MQIVLRKINGRFDAAIATQSGGALRVLPGARSVSDALTSPAMLFVLGLAFLIAFAIAWLTTGHASPLLAAGGAHALMGTHAMVGVPVLGSVAIKAVQDEMAAKQQKLHDAFEKAGDKMDFNNTDFLALVGAKDSSEAVGKIREMNTELEDLGKKRDGLAEMERIAEGNRKRRSDPVAAIQFPNGDEREQTEKARKSQRSLGQIIVESHAFKSFKQHRQPVDSLEADVELKTAFTTSAGWSPQSIRVPGLVIEKATRPVQILDIIPTGPTTQAAVVYMEETTRTHSAAERAENATYAESAFALTQRSETVRTIGDSVPVTDEQLDDVDQVQAYLDQRLTFGVNQRLDNQVINGDGNAPNLTGIVNKAGIQTQAKGADPAQDAFYKAMVNVRVTGRAIPTAHIIHPLDWQGIRLQRTADGIYIWGSPAEAGPERMWGLMVAQADSIAQGTGITGDFATFIQLWVRKGVEIAVGYNSADFINGRKTVRAGMRVALAIYRAAAFSTITGL
jgi:HK97 family phage major capsid protein